jgi:hypothetical protein
MTMTEEQIERRVEIFMDALDRLFMSGSITKADYDSNVRDLNAWAEIKQREVKESVAKEGAEMTTVYELTYQAPNGDWTWDYYEARDFHAALLEALKRCPDGSRVHGVAVMPDNYREKATGAK